MRLLRLPEFAKRAMRENDLSEGVMRPMITKDEEEVRKVLPKIIEEGWTARKVEEYFSDKKKKNQSSANAIKLLEYEKQIKKLTEKYKLKKVAIGAHSITLTCKTKAELDALLEHLV